MGLLDESSVGIPAVEIVTASEIVSEIPHHGEFRTYMFRWFVLATASLLNCSNAYSWIEFAPVANIIDSHYGDNASNHFSIVFMLAAVPVAIFAMWSERRFGLRSSFLVASGMNFLGAVLRGFSMVPGLDQTGRYACVLVGQCLAACAYPFMMFMPTKISAAWFAAKERVLANSVATLSNPLGVLLANLLNPSIIRHVSDIYILHVITLLMCGTAASMAFFGICRSEPEIPPSASAAEESLEFGPGLKRMFTSKNYIIIFVVLGSGLAMFNTVYTVMQQVLCSVGYSNEFAGLCSSLMVIFGTLGSTCVAFFVAKTNLMVETEKTCFCLAVISGLLFIVTSLNPGIAPVIGVACGLFGFFGIAAYPLGMEIGAECSYPVSPTAAAGFIVLSGQIQSAALISMISALAGDLQDFSLEICSRDAKGVVARDMRVPMLTFGGIATMMAVIIVVFFKPKLRRMNKEAQVKKAEDKLAKIPPIELQDLTKPVKA